MDNQVEIKRAVDACVSITGYLRVVLVAIGLVAASPVALDIADLLLLREGPSLSAASAAEKGPTTNRPKDLIIGKWWSMAGSQKVMLEFAKGGAYTTTVGGQTTKGTYKWLDDSTLELNKTQKLKVTVSEDELTMTIGNETSKFERER